MSKFIDRIKDEEVSGETLPLFSVFTMAIPVVEFSREGYKIIKVFG